MKNTKINSIKVAVSYYPTTPDPIEYDDFVHHVAFGSVFSNLVTQYKLGQHTPEIAESWSSNLDHTKWQFVIRSNLKFSNGDSISPQNVVSSLLRVAKKMKSKNSNSGFLEFLEGYENLNNNSDSVSGLFHSGNSIFFNFKKPMPELLDKISFGLYSIVHPSQYDSVTGDWIGGKENIISSGPYVIRKWNDNELILLLRNDYPSELRHRNAISEIFIFWNNLVYSYSDADIAMGSDITISPNTNDKFHGGPKSNIYFMRILGWTNTNSIFHDKTNRIVFRNKFYTSLEKNDISVIRSFFPLIIDGTSELTSVTTTQFFSNTSSIKIPVYSAPFVPNKLNSKVIDLSIEVAQSIGLHINRNKITDDLFDQVSSETTNPTWDLIRFETGILASNPIDDIRFMFNSREGIYLPDETGEIKKEINKEKIDIQKINSLLWDQGLIWPITHISSGLWANDDLDFSQINLSLPPTSFQWIGWK